MNLKIAKTRIVKTPVRGTDFSAGLDLFIPEFTHKFTKDFESFNKTALDEERIYINKIGMYIHNIILAPNTSVLIPSGIYVNLMDVNNGNVKLTATNKSGVASKRQLVTGACLIDSDYQGEILINLINTSSKLVKLTENEKIVQVVLDKVLLPNLEVVELDSLYDTTTQRGDGCLGHTDNK